MATQLPQPLHGDTRRKFRHIVRHAEYLRAHASDGAENAAAVAIARLARDLEAQLGDIVDALDWKLHSVAYDAVDLAIDPRDEAIRTTGDYRPRDKRTLSCDDGAITVTLRETSQQQPITGASELDGRLA